MSWKRDSENANRKWRGPIEKYDLIQEGLVAVVVVAVLVLGLNIVFGAPIVHGVSFQSWAKADPNDFVSTTLTELAGTSEAATYGPPYNNGTGQVQSLGPFSPQTWMGIWLPVNAPQDFVLNPLASVAPTNPEIKTALDTWNGASAAQQQAWATQAISDTITIQGSTVILGSNGRGLKHKQTTDKLSVQGTKVNINSSGDVGPIPTMLSAMLGLAQGGALTSQSIDAPANTYSMNYTKSQLYIADGNYLGDIASYYSMQGEQWGVMNEIGGWPGQPWLWWYTMWYNVPGWSSIGTDILAVATALPVVLFFLLVPFIPGVRSLPRVMRVYKRIWRPYYSRFGTSDEPKR